MYCRKCGEYLNKGQMICPNCGTKADREEEKEQTPAFTGEFGKKKWSDNPALRISVILTVIVLLIFTVFAALKWISTERRTKCLTDMLDRINTQSYEAALYTYTEYLLESSRERKNDSELAAYVEYVTENGGEKIKNELDKQLYALKLYARLMNDLEKLCQETETDPQDEMVRLSRDVDELQEWEEYLNEAARQNVELIEDGIEDGTERMDRALTECIEAIIQDAKTKEEVHQTLLEKRRSMEERQDSFTVNELRELESELCKKWSDSITERDKKGEALKELTGFDWKDRWSYSEGDIFTQLLGTTAMWVVGDVKFGENDFQQNFGEWISNIEESVKTKFNDYDADHQYYYAEPDTVSDEEWFGSYLDYPNYIDEYIEKILSFSEQWESQENAKKMQFTQKITQRIMRQYLFEQIREQIKNSAAIDVSSPAPEQTVEGKKKKGLFFGKQKEEDILRRYLEQCLIPRYGVAKETSYKDVSGWYELSDALKSVSGILDAFIGDFNGDGYQEMYVVTGEYYTGGGTSIWDQNTKSYVTGYLKSDYSEKGYYLMRLGQYVIKEKDTEETAEPYIECQGAYGWDYLWLEDFEDVVIQWIDTRTIAYFEHNMAADHPDEETFCFFENEAGGERTFGISDVTESGEYEAAFSYRRMKYTTYSDVTTLTQPVLVRSVSSSWEKELNRLSTVFDPLDLEKYSEKQYDIAQQEEYYRDLEPYNLGIYADTSKFKKFFEVSLEQDEVLGEYYHDLTFSSYNSESVMEAYRSGSERNMAGRVYEGVLSGDYREDLGKTEKGYLFTYAVMERRIKDSKTLDVLTVKDTEGEFLIDDKTRIEFSDEFLENAPEEMEPFLHEKKAIAWVENFLENREEGMELEVRARDGHIDAITGIYW